MGRKGLEAVENVGLEPAETIEKQLKSEDSMHERMMDKTTQPTDADMINWIGQPVAEAWTALRRFLVETYDIVPVFNSGGKRYGWNLQHRIGGQPLCEMCP